MIRRLKDNKLSGNQFKFRKRKCTVDTIRAVLDMLETERKDAFNNSSCIVLIAHRHRKCIHFDPTGTKYGSTKINKSKRTPDETNKDR